MVDSTDSRRAKLVAEFGEAGADGHSITEARQVPLSRASPPITPIRGSGYSFTPTRRVIDAPDWDFWRHLPDVEIWQACALSLNLEPDKFEWSGDSWLLGPGDHGPSIESTSFRDSDEEASFYKRVKLLCANLFRREHFSAPILNMGKSFKSRAKLPEVAAWAAGIGWSLPDAFPAPAAPSAIKPRATAQASADPSPTDSPMPVETSANKGKGAQPKKDVTPARLRIQQEATEVWIRWLANGGNPTVYAIRDEVAKWCSDNQVKLRGGVCPKAGTLRNTVLGAGHWTPPTLSREKAKAHVAQVARQGVAQVARDDD